VIAQHINQKTGQAMLSDDAIADEAGRGSIRNVFRSRQRLRGAGWLVWRRTRLANVYKLLFDRMDRTLDMITTSREARREKRIRNKTEFVTEPADMTRASYLNDPDMTYESR
jgi:hypothetical protein